MLISGHKNLGWHGLSRKQTKQLTSIVRLPGGFIHQCVAALCCYLSVNLFLLLIADTVHSITASEINTLISMTDIHCHLISDASLDGGFVWKRA